MFKEESDLQKYIRGNGLTVLDYKTRYEILKLPSPIYREVKTHKLYGCGRPDLASLKGETLYIIEAKFGKAKHRDVGQLMAYLNYFQFLVDRGKIKIAETKPISVIGILVAETYYKRLKKPIKGVTLDMSVFWAMYPVREKIMLVEWARRGNEVAFFDVTGKYEDIFTNLRRRYDRGAEK